MSNSYELLIRESHLDTFGHINNATYLQIFEEARWELITRHGFGLRQIQERGHGPVILEINVKFLREVKLREKVQVTVEALNYKGLIGQLRQQMINQNGELACEALVTYGLFDLKIRKLIPPTTEWLEAVSGRLS